MDASSPPGKVRVCLVGPRNGGKSHLLFALTEGTKTGAHGFPTSWNLRVEPTSDIQRNAKSSTDRLKTRGQSEYEKQIQRAISQTLPATMTDQIANYDFDLVYRHNGSAPQRTSFIVADAAGGHIFPERVSVDDDIDGERADQGTRDEVIDYLKQAVGLVIVLPLHRVQDPRFSRLMDPLIDALVPNDTPGTEPMQLQRISIALNQYERLFTEFGSDAAQIAAVPEVARGVARSRLSNVPFMERVRELDRSWGGPYDVRIIPTSAYGFLPGFGNPNINPDSAPNTPFVAFEAPDGSVIEFEQHPFLAADPFVFAATGFDNDFMVTISDIYGEPDDDVIVARGPDIPLDLEERERPPPPPRLGFFRRIERMIGQFFSP